MRVVSGKYRGRKILSPEGSDIRPTSDMVKENIFNVIQFEIAGSKFLDLFCGSGGVGLEALSRGASKVTFVDKSNMSISLTRTNLHGIKDNFEIVQRNALDALRGIREKQKFIFVDPPYKSDYINDICDIVAEKDLLEDDGYIIYEHDSDKKYQLSTKYILAKSKKYGKIIVDYIQKAQSIVAVTGSFDPMTKGHLWLIDKALEEFDKVVVIVAINEEKNYMFDLAERKQILQDALRDYPNVMVESTSGMVYELCEQLGIGVILRGYRNQADFEYERVISKFNKEHGNIETLLIQSHDMDINSTAVRKALESGNSIKGLVPENCIKIITKLFGEKNERNEY